MLFLYRIWYASSEVYKSMMAEHFCGDMIVVSCATILMYLGIGSLQLVWMKTAKQKMHLNSLKYVCSPWLFSEHILGRCALPTMSTQFQLS
jgi:hypothetical protein